jgi:hypothetical protein
MSSPSDHTSVQNSNLSSPRADSDQAQAHFNWLFSRALSDRQSGDTWIVQATISLQRKISFQAFDSTLDAARWAVKESINTNVYTHLALHTPDRPKGKGNTDTTLCLTALAADLDAASPYRGSNAGKAPDVASLRLLICDFEESYQFPLTVIESGYGLYAMVRFREPLWLEDKRARKEADDLLGRFTEAFRIFGRKRGWPNTVDRVPLAGLIRVAGTLNHKGNPPLPVRFSRNVNGDFR